MFKRTTYRTYHSGYALYEITDHLGNVRAVIQKTGQGIFALTNKTDSTPLVYQCLTKQQLMVCTDKPFKGKKKTQKRESDTI